MTALAIDIGGSGSRLAAVDARGRYEILGEGPGVEVEAHGIHTERLLDVLLTAPHATSLPGKTRLPVEPAAVVIGMSGVLSLGGGVESLAASARHRWPGSRIIAASDAVTGLVGTLGVTGGASVTAGTGVIALGSDLARTWRRVDGWGHLLGDEGGGAWIGLRGLRAALRAHDGRGGSAPLASAAGERFGDLDALPRLLYTRDDRAKVLASFAPDVAAAARAGDPFAVVIWRRAGRHLAASALAALAEGLPQRVALSGGLVSAGELLVDPFREALAASGVTEVRVEDARAPLAGAAALAALLLDSPERIHHHPPYLAKVL